MNETKSSLCFSRHLSPAFPPQNGDRLWPLLLQRKQTEGQRQGPCPRMPWTAWRSRLRAGREGAAHAMMVDTKAHLCSPHKHPPLYPSIQSDHMTHLVVFFLAWGTSKQPHSRTQLVTSKRVGHIRPGGCILYSLVSQGMDLLWAKGLCLAVRAESSIFLGEQTKELLPTSLSVVENQSPSLSPPPGQLPCSFYRHITLLS